MRHLKEFEKKPVYSLKKLTKEVYTVCNSLVSKIRGEASRKT